MSEFQPFASIERLTQNITITEKIRGTNALGYVYKVVQNRQVNP